MVRESVIETYLRKSVEKKGAFVGSLKVPLVEYLIELFYCQKVSLPLEVKRQGGIPRPQQVKRILQIQRLGIKAGWVDSIESVEEFLDEISSKKYISKKQLSRL